MKSKILLVVSIAVLSSSACVAQQKWQPATVRDVSDSGGKVVVEQQHGQLRYHEIGDVRQIYAIQAGDTVYYAERKEGGRLSPSCEVPVNAKVSVHVKGNSLRMHSDQGKYKFKVVKSLTAQQFAALPKLHPRSAMEEPSADGTVSAAIE